VTNVRDAFPAFAQLTLDELGAEHQRILEVLHPDVALGRRTVGNAGSNATGVFSFTRVRTAWMQALLRNCTAASTEGRNRIGAGIAAGARRPCPDRSGHEQHDGRTNE
jgi:hypothetical protein